MNAVFQKIGLLCAALLVASVSVSAAVGPAATSTSLVA
jgi:hypothetical protein